MGSKITFALLRKILTREKITSVILALAILLVQPTAEAGTGTNRGGKINSFPLPSSQLQPMQLPPIAAALNLDDDNDIYILQTAPDFFSDLAEQLALRDSAMEATGVDPCLGRCSTTDFASDIKRMRDSMFQPATPMIGDPATCKTGVSKVIRQTRASYYGHHDGFVAGMPVACGGKAFNPRAMTTAVNVHLKYALPCGTHLVVTAPNTGRSIEVVVNDTGGLEGPRSGRSIDLTYGAALKLGITRAGVAAVKIQVCKK